MNVPPQAAPLPVDLAEAPKRNEDGRAPRIDVAQVLLVRMKIRPKKFTALRSESLTEW